MAKISGGRMKAKLRCTGTLMIVLCTLGPVLTSEPAQTQPSSERDHLFISTLLFPETSGWMRIADMPALRRAELDLLESRLRGAFKKSELYERTIDNSECSFIDGMFNPSDAYERYFRRFDLNSDGHDDIIYCGSAICEGGDAATVIWLGEESGFRIRQRYLWKIGVLRIRPGNPVGVASVEVGCCASPYDIYSIGTLDNPRVTFENTHKRNGIGPLTITKYTVLPKILLGPFGFKIQSQELEVRTSPEIDDAYTEAGSEMANNAVFGNILSKYLAGCGGTVVGMNKEEGPDLWYFVVLDECQRFRTHSPFEVDAGWVKATDIEVLK